MGRRNDAKELLRQSKSKIPAHKKVSDSKQDLQDTLASIERRLDQIEEVLRLLLVNSVMVEAGRCLEEHEDNDCSSKQKNVKKNRDIAIGTIASVAKNSSTGFWGQFSINDYHG